MWCLESLMWFLTCVTFPSCFLCCSVSSILSSQQFLLLSLCFLWLLLAWSSPRFWLQSSLFSSLAFSSSCVISRERVCPELPVVSGDSRPLVVQSSSYIRRQSCSGFKMFGMFLCDSGFWILWGRSGAFETAKQYTSEFYSKFRYY